MAILQVLALVTVLAVPQNAPVSLDAVLARAADHVAALREKAAIIAAKESSVQVLRPYGSTRTDLMASGPPLGQLGDPKSRKLQAEFVLMAPAGSPVWQAFRDVFDIDGKSLRPERDRLRKELEAGDGLGVEPLRQLTVESVRYDLAKTPHGVNVPTFPLVFLQRDQQKGVAFEKKSEKTVDGVRVWVVSFRETAPPLARLIDGTPQPSRGEFYIEPASGAVLRTHLVFDSSEAYGDRATHPGQGQFVGGRSLATGRSESVQRVTIDVSYKRNAQLDAWLPVEMRELYDRQDEVVNVTATYSDYRAVAGIAKEGAAGRRATARRITLIVAILLSPVSVASRADVHESLQTSTTSPQTKPGNHGALRRSATGTVISSWRGLVQALARQNTACESTPTRGRNSDA
jgi:hypothetical protein